MRAISNCRPWRQEDSDLLQQANMTSRSGFAGLMHSIGQAHVLAPPSSSHFRPSEAFFAHDETIPSISIYVHKD